MSATLGPRLRYKSKVVDHEVDFETIKKKLSEFQIEKLTFLFRFFDINRDGLIDESDNKALAQKLIKLAGWNAASKDAMMLEAEIKCVLECMLEEIRKDQGQGDDSLEFRTWEEALRPNKIVLHTINLNQWLFMWAKMLQGAAGINDFPIWVQILPKVLLRSIAQGDEIISKENLRSFYANFVEIKAANLEATLNEGFRTMTGDNEYDLDMENYSLVFCNFLLGRTIYGPGKYVFGCFDNSDMKEKYKVIYE